MLLPESPRWLARKDRWEEAHEVLALVHGKGDRSHPFVAIELQDIREMCELEREFGNVTYLDLFTPRMIHRTLIGLFTQIWSQLTGMNVMSEYFRCLYFYLQLPHHFNVLYSKSTSTTSPSLFFGVSILYFD